MICPHCDKDTSHPVEYCESGSADTGVWIDCILRRDHPGPCMAAENNPIVFGGRCDGRPE